MTTFEQNLKRGKLAESKIARWLRQRGWTVIPVYEIEMGQSKGPQIYTPDNELIAPDLLARKENRFRFIEAKNKSVFTWYRKTEQWQTGIDQKHWNHYLDVADHFGLDIWLMFLHENSTPDRIDQQHDSCPLECPVGLFGNPIAKLKNAIDHKDSRHGRTGMVYWNHRALQLICELQDLETSEVSFSFERAPIVGVEQSLFPSG